MIKTFFHITAIIYLIVMGVAGISACAMLQPAATAENQGAIGEASLPRPVDRQFPVLPFPPGYEMDRDRSFIYESGRGQVKVGGIHLSVFDTPDDMVSFYRAEMKSKGWRLIQMVDHRGTLMLYEKKTLICTIVIESSAEKTLIVIHIGPK